MAIYGGFSLPAALAENTPVYKLTRTAADQTDATLLATVTSPADGAIAIITTTIDGKTYGQVSFMYSEEQGDWLAMSMLIMSSFVVILPLLVTILRLVTLPSPRLVLVPLRPMVSLLLPL